MSLEEIKNKLIELYLFLKIRKTDEIENITKEDIEKEKNNLNILSVNDIINYIKTSIEILIELKASEKYEEKIFEDESKKFYKNKENKNDENGLILYEGMLIKAEKDIRKHIRVKKYIIYNFSSLIQIEQELKLRLEEVENELNYLKDNKNLIGIYQKFCFDTIDNQKTISNNTIDNKEESKNPTNYKANKEELNQYPITGINSKPKKKKDTNKVDKKNTILVKKLENENAHLRKLLIIYKLKKSKLEKSTEKMKKFYNYFEKKLLTLSDNKNNTINSSNLSNIYNHTNNDTSLNSISNNFSNAKNSLTYNILDMEKMTIIPKKIKNIKKNSDSCSILLTEGNAGKSIKKSKYKEIRPNSKDNKILITEIKLNKTNNKIKKNNKSKMNSIYYNRNSIINNGKQMFEIYRNNDLNNNIGAFNTNFDRKKTYHLNTNFTDKYNFKRNNKNLTIKSSHNSLNIGNTIPMLIKTKNDININYNNTNTILLKGKKIKEKMNSFNKNLLANVISHNSINNTIKKADNLFEKKRNLKMNKKKFNNFHSISSVSAKKLNDSKFNSSISFDTKKVHNNTNKNINNNILEQIIKKSEKSLDNKISKEKGDYLNANKNKLKKFMTYSSKVKKVINENMSKNLKRLNTNLRNDNKLMQSNQKKNNIFFTINKTIIHNMNNTFHNSQKKFFKKNINNSTDEVNNEGQISPNSLLKNSLDNNNSQNLYNGNFQNKLISKCKITNNYSMNNSKFSSVLKTNANERISKKIKIN